MTLYAVAVANLDDRLEIEFHEAPSAVDAILMHSACDAAKTSADFASVVRGECEGICGEPFRVIAVREFLLDCDMVAAVKEIPA